MVAVRLGRGIFKLWTAVLYDDDLDFSLSVAQRQRHCPCIPLLVCFGLEQRFSILVLMTHGSSCFRYFPAHLNEINALPPQQAIKCCRNLGITLLFKSGVWRQGNS